MYSEKKMSKEDTWRTEDLLKHMRGHRYDDASGNKRDHLDMDDNRKARRGESGDRRHRDQQKTSHKERDGTEGKSKHKDLDKGRHRNDTQGRTTHRDTEKDRDRDRTREKTRYRDLDREQDRTHGRARHGDLEQEQEGTRERRRHKDLERDGDRDDGTREKIRHRDLERDRDRDDGTREKMRHRDLDRDRDRDDGTREKIRHRDLERDRDRDDGTREKIRHRDLERDRDRDDGTREKIRHRDLERERDQHPRKDTRREKAEERDKREPERRQEWEGIEKRDYDKGHERAEKEHRKTERRRAERGREYGEGRERERDREKDQERWKEKDGYKDQGWSHSIRHVKENDQSKDKVQGKFLEPPNEHRRHKDGQHSRQKEDKEYKEQRHKEKEERERRRREREQREAGESRRRDKLSGDREEMRREDVRRDMERRKDDRHREGRRREDRDPGKALAKLTAGSQRHSAQGGPEKPGFGRRHLAEPEAKIGDPEVSSVSSEKQVEEEGAEEYEEDFEDYEEDFEEADDSDEVGGSDEGGGGRGEQMSAQQRKEVEVIQRAMEAENRRLGSVQSTLQMGECEEAGRDGTPDGAVSHSRTTQQGKFIDFVAAKHREMSKKIGSKQKKRSAELLRLVDLDFSVTLSLLDLPPLTEYDMYIKSFGSTDTKQAYAQCREDDVDRDVQTEEVETSDRWTQHPADRGLVCGGPGLTGEASDKHTGGESLASPRLAAFLLSASQVMTVLLEEDRLERFSLCKPNLQRDALPFSDGRLQLGSGMPFLHGREVSLMVFSQTQRQTVLSVHRPSARPSAVHLDSKTILCIWNIWEPSCPQKILVYESEVSCCCFGPGKASLVFAGTAVGSLVLWDLREQSSLHCSIRIGEQDWTLRYPTFSTDAVLAASGHLSPVMAVEPIPPSTPEAHRDSFPQLPWQEESSGMSFQLGSLDEKGVLNLWVVVELPQGDEAGSHSNLGLRPGGRVKLLHSSAVAVLQRSSPVEALALDSIQSLLLKFHPSDSKHFYVGTDMNLVYHGTRHGLRSPPTFYRSQKGGRSPVPVTSLDFSPFDESIFLVACGDGSMRLHSVSSESPIMEWSCGVGGSTLSARWSLTRPAMFCTLDPATSIICMWDLLQKESEPVAMEKVHPDRITSMAVFGDPSKQNSFSGILLATHSGQLEIHYLSRSWTAPGHCELERLQNLAGDIY
ncbi:cytoplasmic dynein 2 intermediate chain 1 [Brienomyrus brachyistius]|uniref:cytoplasmic dynein 2 intermediate chain 1 n=1 Tax=Brienomyrus brachyistius TaxID=42636 RepID=UPI0020B2D201|nr:cytoplasmic dynein 2 intermediate chain 1 [Brienomyrus brachyistius]